MSKEDQDNEETMQITRDAMEKYASVFKALALNDLPTLDEDDQSGDNQ